MHKLYFIYRKTVDENRNCLIAIPIWVFWKIKMYKIYEIFLENVILF